MVNVVTMLEPALTRVGDHQDRDIIFAAALDRLNCRHRHHRQCGLASQATKMRMSITPRLIHWLTCLVDRADGGAHVSLSGGSDTGLKMF